MLWNDIHDIYEICDVLYICVNIIYKWNVIWYCCINTHDMYINMIYIYIEYIWFIYVYIYMIYI